MRPKAYVVTPELRDFIIAEVKTIRMGAPFGVFDIRVFAAYDGRPLDDVPGASIKAIIEKHAKPFGKNVVGQGLWVRV